MVIAGDLTEHDRDGVRHVAHDRGVGVGGEDKLEVLFVAAVEWKSGNSLESGATAASRAGGRDGAGDGEGGQGDQKNSFEHGSG